MNGDIEGLVDVSAEILDVLRGLNVDQMQLMKTATIYREMGYKLLKLLQLLFLCDPSKEHLAPLIRNVINISCDITAAVTVDIFCVWAEVSKKILYALLKTVTLAKLNNSVIHRYFIYFFVLMELQPDYI